MVLYWYQQNIIKVDKNMKVITDKKTKTVCYLKQGSDIKKNSRKIATTKKQIADRHLNSFYNSLPSVKSKQKPINSKFFAHCKKFANCL
jgi:hypothetical protein